MILILSRGIRPSTEDGAVHIARTVSTTGDAFRATVNGRATAERTEAARLLHAGLMTAAAANRAVYTAVDIDLRARIGGHDFTFVQLPDRFGARQWQAHIHGVPRTDVFLSGDSISDGIGAIRTLENRAAGLPTILDTLRTTRAEAQTAQTAAESALARPFLRTAELQAAQAEHNRVAALIAERATHRADQPADATSPPQPGESADSTVAVTTSRPTISTPTSAARTPDPPPPTTHPSEAHPPLPSPEDRTTHHVRPEEDSRDHRPTAPTPSPQTVPAGSEEPLIQHGRAGTLVVNTSRSDIQLRHALASAGFKWSVAQRFWYLPRNLGEDARAQRIARLQGALARNGRELAVTAHPDDRPPPVRPHGRPTQPDPASPQAAWPRSAPKRNGQFDTPDHCWRAHFQHRTDVLRDDHWPTLAGQLEHLHAAGVDVAPLISHELPHIDPASVHPARDLDYRIADHAYLPPLSAPDQARSQPAAAPHPSTPSKPITPSPAPRGIPR